MSAQDKLEKVLRGLHVLLSKSEPYPKEPSKVIVDKQQVLNLLSELNKSAYEIMDEYELTRQSRDRAEREFRKKGDEIIWDASRKAEDIYAASVMYTDEALNEVQQIVRSATASVQEIYESMEQKLKEEERKVRTNQSDLKSSLQDLRDTEKYLKLIEQRNREIEKEKEEKSGKKEYKENIYANRQTEIKINTAYLEKMGMSVDERKDDSLDDLSEETQEERETKLKESLDAEYFNWKEDSTSEKRDDKKIEVKAGIQKVLKNITGNKK